MRIEKARAEGIETRDGNIIFDKTIWFSKEG